LNDFGRERSAEISKQSVRNFRRFTSEKTAARNQQHQCQTQPEVSFMNTFLRHNPKHRERRIVEAGACQRVRRPEMCAT
jgi:hypothetical protein